MKLLFLLFTIILLAFGNLHANAQTTITLQPDSSNGKDAEIGLIVPNDNYGNSGKFSPYAWTQSSVLNVVRPLIEFDLSGIPANATITDAKLSLYYNPNYPALTQHNGSNALWIQRITSPWNENTVTWNTQPTTTTTNQVSVPQSTSPTQNYPNIDVTLLVQDMMDSANSHGFMIQLQNESPYADVMLASSDNTDSTLYPKLYVCYTINAGVNESIHLQGVINIYPNPFISSTTIQLNSNISNGALNIFNVYGQKIKTIKNISGQEIKLFRDNLPNGIYFIRLTQDNRVIATDKLIIID